MNKNRFMELLISLILSNFSIIHPKNLTNQKNALYRVSTINYIRQINKNRIRVFFIKITLNEQKIEDISNFILLTIIFGSKNRQ